MTNTTTNVTEEPLFQPAAVPANEPTPVYEVRRLVCALTDAETLARATELAKTHDEIATLKLQKKAAADSFKAKIELKTQREQELIDVLRSREEQRDVRCVERPEFRLGQVDIVRLDTGAVIETRVMEAHERQPDLFTRAPNGDTVRKDTGEVVVPAREVVDPEAPFEDDEAMPAIDDPQALLDIEQGQEDD